MELEMGDDGMVSIIKGQCNTYYVDNGSNGVIEVDGTSKNDISNSDYYSAYPCVNTTHNCIVVFLNKNLAGIGREGGFAVYKDIAEIEYLIEETKE
jgi:hypothetical protein